MHVIATAGYSLRSLYHVPRLLPAPALTLDTSCSDIFCYQYLSNLPLQVASLKGKSPGIKCDDTAGATRVVQQENAFTGERTYAGGVGSRYCAVKFPLPKHEKYHGKEVEAGILWTLLYFSTLETKTLPQTAHSLSRLQIINSNKIQQCKPIPKSATQLQHPESPNIGNRNPRALDPLSSGSTAPNPA